MPTRRGLTGSGVRRGRQHEVVRLLRQIQALTLELRELRLGETGVAELDAKERALEQLRWRLATVARRAAGEDLGPAA